MARRDPRSPRHRRVERTDREPEPVGEEGQALRARLQTVRALPAPRTPPHRRHHLAEPTLTTTHPHPRSPLKRVEPHCPSGKFFANAAWLGCAVLAHNLIRWTAHLG